MSSVDGGPRTHWATLHRGRTSNRRIPRDSDRPFGERRGVAGPIWVSGDTGLGSTGGETPGSTAPVGLRSGREGGHATGNDGASTGSPVSAGGWEASAEQGGGGRRRTGQ